MAPVEKFKQIKSKKQIFFQIYVLNAHGLSGSLKVILVDYFLLGPFTLRLFCIG